MGIMEKKFSNFADALGSLISVSYPIARILSPSRAIGGGILGSQLFESKNLEILRGAVQKSFGRLPRLYEDRDSVSYITAQGLEFGWIWEIHPAIQVTAWIADPCGHYADLEATGWTHVAS